MKKATTCTNLNGKNNIQTNTQQLNPERQMIQHQQIQCIIILSYIINAALSFVPIYYNIMNESADLRPDYMIYYICVGTNKSSEFKSRLYDLLSITQKFAYDGKYENRWSQI